MTTSKRTMTFIGGGNMALAIARGLVAASADYELTIVEPLDAQRDVLREALPSATLTATLNNAAAAADVIVLAVKPQVLAGVCRELAQRLGEHEPLVVSIAAGVTIAALRGWLGSGPSIVRAMPNQPAMIGYGMTGLAADGALESESKEIAAEIAAATRRGAVARRRIDDGRRYRHIGQRPAYFYLVMETMADTAREFGFSADDARRLCVATALGSAALASQSGDSLALLRERVTSPGGTTAAAIESLEQAGIRDIFRAALTRARERGRELAAATGR